MESCSTSFWEYGLFTRADVRRLCYQGATRAPAVPGGNVVPPSAAEKTRRYLRRSLSDVEFFRAASAWYTKAGLPVPAEYRGDMAEKTLYAMYEHSMAELQGPWLNSYGAPREPVRRA